ncbi:hypothetical protein GGI12_004788 [Dipsacomyces acuminosporus]|nr:hypothetical protein GGI12_004788 [Dipsacomyces acuminosporus]
MTGDSGPVWVSNIGLIVSQRRSDYIRQLEINIYDDRASGTAVAALDEYGFSSVYWPRLSRLHLYCLYFQSFISPRDSEEKMATRIANYFINHLPNLACLHLDISNTGEGCEVFLNKMANAYLPRLHTLYTGNKVGITFNAHNRFGENLTYLTLKMNTDSSNRLPWIMAAQLQYLKLTDIPEHFTWSTFYSDSPSSVTFANLQKLFMFFKSETLAELLHRGNDSESKIMRIINQDANNRQLRFPKLQTLSLSRNPYSDSAFYERFVQAPLRTVNISGSFRSMHSMHNEMLVDLYKLTLDIKRIGDDYGFNDVSLFLSRLFYTPSSVQVAELFAYYRNMQPLYIKGSIGWYNIERLELYVDVIAAIAASLASVNGYHIVNQPTVSCKFDPYYKSQTVRDYLPRDSFDIKCKQSGQSVNGDTLWVLTNADCFVPNAYVNTGGVISTIPQC